MIRFTLRCAQDHHFESWFRSSDAFDVLVDAKQLSCPDCGDTDVAKSMMAPRVQGGRDTPAPPTESKAAAMRKAIADLRNKVEASAHWVGADFVREARSIHDGDSPQRAIWGEARPDQARALIADGIEVAPLPFGPKRKTN